MIGEGAPSGVLQQGAMVGSYRILSRVGDGGMGIVYLAEHALLGRQAAVKVLRPEVSHVPTAVQRFFNEARATTTIRHPGIVEIFDFGYTPDRQAFIVMEWLVGSSLADRLARERFPQVTTLVLMRRMVGALAAAHARAVVHRDLKPDNVFLVRDPEGGDIPQVKLLDFGIAKLLDDGLASPRQTATGVVIGTPLYMSPEQCRAGHCDHRADLYSMGCVLFEMIAGRPPFCAASTAELLAAHLMQKPPPLEPLVPGIPPAVSALVARLLAKDPAARPRDAMAVATELDRLIATIAPQRLSAERATVLEPGFANALPPLPSLATPLPLDRTSPFPDAAPALAPSLGAPPTLIVRTGVSARLAIGLGLGGVALAVCAAIAAVALLRPPPYRPPPRAPAPRAASVEPPVAVDAAIPDAAIPDAAIPDAAIPDAPPRVERRRRLEPGIGTPRKIDVDQVVGD